MRIALFDDSIAFDAYMPDAFPLGGAEKAFARLPGALARRGHEVTVFNRGTAKVTIEGATWHEWDDTRPLEVDALIAYRRPRLLREVRVVAKKRLLWAVAKPAYLQTAAADALLAETEAELMLVGTTQKALYSGTRPVNIVAPGVSDPYLTVSRVQVEVPVALCTTHPDNGLEWLLDLWAEQIRPQAPTARLHVYSRLLTRRRRHETLPERYAPLLEKAEALKDRGVELKEPLGDEIMAQVYRSARVHLYPGHGDDMACWTLMESQATGLPAVARTKGAIHERMINGESGYIVPDDAAFANVAVQVLTDDGVFGNLSTGAADPLRKRSWDLVAQDVEALLG